MLAQPQHVRFASIHFRRAHKKRTVFLHAAAKPFHRRGVAVSRKNRDLTQNGPRYKYPEAE